MKRLVSIACLSGLCLSLSGCASTNIARIGQNGSFEIEADERRMWNRAEELEEILNKSGYIYQDDQLTSYVNSVLHKLVGDYEENNTIKLRASIIKDPFLNAFCLPNGAIYVHTSILANADNEAQLATLLGHEATHFLYRHQLKETRSIVNKSAFASTWSVTFGSVAGVYGGAADLVNLLGQYCVMGSVYGYSRDIEREADRNAFELVKNSGYPYKETKKFMENLYDATKDEKKKVPYFYSTHPEIRKRIKDYQQFIDNLSKGDSESGKKEPGYEDANYNKMIKNVLLDNAELDLKRNNIRIAKKEIERYNKLYPNDARGYSFLGQAYLLEGKLDEAEKELKNSIKHNPDFAESHKFLGMLYYRRGEKNKANAEFAEYLRLKPSASDAEYIRGYINE